VVIRAIAAGSGRAQKIAVMSKDKDVDAVGACVGMKGMRVQSIIREFVERRSTSSSITRMQLRSRRKRCSCESEPGNDRRCDGQAFGSGSGRYATLAGDAGKRAEVRLAAKLLGWKIDIKSEEEKRQEVEQQMSALVTQTVTPLEIVTGLGRGWSRN